MKNGKLLIAPSMLWLGIFFIVPMLIVVAVSFAARTPYGQVVFNWNINNYLRFLEPLYLSIFAQTLLVALVTTVVTILMGYPLAYYIAQLPKRWQQPGLILCMIPFWINFLIRSYAWVIILEQLDRRLLEAASDLGAAPFTAFRKITLPLTMPGVAAGTILVFISSLGMFVVPDVMGGAKSALVGNLIQNQFLSARDWPFGSALSIVLAALSLLLIILYYRAIQAQNGGAENAKNMA